MRPRNMVLYTLVLMLGISGTASAAWIDQGSPTRVEPRVAAAGPMSSVIVDVEVPGFEMSTLDIDGRSHTRLALPDHVWHMERGYPELPYITQSIAVAGEGTPSLRVLDSEWNEIAVDPVVPSKGHLTRDLDPDEIPYSFAALYSEGGVYPQATTELSEPFIVRDRRGVVVRVNAFRYDADRGVLLVLRSMRLEVVTSGLGGLNAKRETATAVDPQFDRIYRQLFANYGADKYVTVGVDGPMLVVTADAYQGAVTPFVEWKQQKGLPVELITTSSVGGTAAGIQGAIDTRYASGAGLTYVVLVGDIADVPTNSGTYESADSDSRYAMVDGGDLYPDLFVSRISAQNAQQVTDQVEKFIRYERDPDTGAAAEWYHKGTGLASNEGSPTDYERAEYLRQDLLGYTFTFVDEIYQPTATSAMIAAALNEGRSIINYIGHGSGTSWSNPPWANSDIHALENGWAQPWILDVSCSNGDFSNSECFAEAWLRATGASGDPNGAIATYSASTLASWVPPCDMQGEAVDLLVAESANTLGALYYHGGMHALDLYPGTSSEGHKLIEQYNIFGDCSLMVRTDVPAAVTATHLPVVYMGVANFAVSDLPEGAVATLWRDGVIHGSAVADAGGLADIVLDTPVTTAGDVTLTVTGYNLETYQVLLSAINPSTVVIDPTVIDANTPTDVTVTVYGPDGITPLAGIDVWAQGLGYATVPVATDVNGVAVINVDYPYGPTLTILGQDPAETYLLFEEEITVNALALTAPDLDVTTAFGMSDQYGLNLPGTMNATVTEPGHTLFVILPDGTELSTTDLSLEATPGDLGQVTGVIAVSGYDAYSELFDVVEAYGTLSGNVSDGAKAPIGGVQVYVYHPDSGTYVGPETTDASGDYALPDPLLVDDYTVIVDHFGYLHYESPIFLGYGANVHDIVLEAAPAGDLAGFVTESGAGAPLEATVSVYRSDTAELVDEVTSDPVDGSYTVTGLTYFTYDVSVRAYHHMPLSESVVIDASAVSRDFVLDPTEGNILVIDDNAKADRDLPPKFSEKPRVMIAPPYHALPSRTATDMVDDLTGLGYSVVLEDLSATDSATWPSYDMVLVSTADSQADLGDAAFRSDLIDFVDAGGHLLIEGGELAWNHDTENPAFAASVLHIVSWNGDNGGDLTVADPLHNVMSTPNVIAGPIPHSYSGYGDADRVTPTTDAQLVGDWSTYSGASVVCYDPTPSPVGGPIVFFAFDYGALSGDEALNLLHNAVVWLLAVEAPGTASVSGTVTLQGSGDHSGVLVELLPAGESLVTDATGYYEFTDLHEGSYTVRASRESWSLATAGISLAEGEALTDVDLILTHVYETEVCDSPAMSIPDNTSTGVSTVMPVSVATGATVSSMEVFIDLTHTYIGDLIIELTSPTGTTVRVHNKSGGTAEDIYGWYPLDLTPAEDLDDFAGVDLNGDWELFISDTGPSDLGTLNQWCLRVNYGGGTTAVDDVTGRFALGQNYPNPFNPSTTISFAVPRAGHVSLKVYDLAGRHVRTLVDGDLPADTHAVVWDGRNTSGRQVSSGAYYYRLNAAGHAETKQMVLIK